PCGLFLCVLCSRRLDGDSSVDSLLTRHAERAPRRDHLFREMRWDRRREEETLRLQAAQALQLARLPVVLDALSHDAGLQRTGERQNALDHRRPIVLHQTSDE